MAARICLPHFGRNLVCSDRRLVCRTWLGIDSVRRKGIGDKCLRTIGHKNCSIRWSCIYPGTVPKGRSYQSGSGRSRACTHSLEGHKRKGTAVGDSPLRWTWGTWARIGFRNCLKFRSYRRGISVDIAFPECMSLLNREHSQVGNSILRCRT